MIPNMGFISGYSDIVFFFSFAGISAETATSMRILTENIEPAGRANHMRCFLLSLIGRLVIAE